MPGIRNKDVSFEAIRTVVFVSASFCVWEGGGCESWILVFGRPRLDRFPAAWTEISSLTTDITAPAGIPELIVVWKSVRNAPPTSFWCEKAK